ncbi:MAG: ATP-dependent helicase [Saprospiraceae bacterium]|nr:ATP-dependent helicase [Saprospiraceae bacterium]
MSKIRQDYLNKFLNAYNGLNEKQKEAVDHIEGPVMVIAGPGTGKTQLLAIRAGNILLKTDAFPHNILCLTYTDAGSIAMRNRLLEFIGPDAHNVHIHTFHAFCSMVIRENMQYFGNFREVQLLSDLEEVEVYRKIIDALDEQHPLKRLKGDIYNDIRRFKELFGTMKKENWTADTFKNAFDKYKAIITDKDHPENDFIYSKKTKDNRTGNYFEKGDLKIYLIEKELEKYEKIVLAANELENYNNELIRRERYDYADMILWVIEKFRQHDELLGKYQERFQYILVDEYQDTNGAQNNILFQLADYWEESPNLFIVGDDDQSIYRFQGANMNNILDFKDKYNPLEIVLTDNYRSSQLILDRARILIENNEERLVRKYDYLTKDLVEKRKKHPDDPVDPQIIQYQNITQEEVGIIQKILELQKNGTPLNDIAVIYSKHKLVDNLVQYLTSMHIPLNVKKRLNVLKQPEVEKLINILEYIHAELNRPHSAEDRLFEILHYHYFEISALDIARISVYCRPKHDKEANVRMEAKFWREVISNHESLQEAGVQDATKIMDVAKMLENRISDIVNVTVQTLIEKIMTECGILNSALLSPDKSWQLQLLNTFFDYIKNQAASVREFKLQDALEMIRMMNESGIELPINRIISNTNGVHFVTAHGSKGLEYEHVFIIRSNKGVWEEKRGDHTGSFSYLPTMLSAKNDNNTEDDRRLFYVAMTRAKHYLYISYAAENDEEKAMEQSRFISEILGNENEILQANLDEDDILSYKVQLMKYKSGVAKLIDHEMIDKMLEDFRMSSTNLNKYLRCRLSFYFETILRVPGARSATMGFGNAIHYAFEQFFRDIRLSKPRSVGSQQKLKDFFAKGMEIYRSHFTQKEFENYTLHGNEILVKYYEEYNLQWLKPKDYELELNIDATEYRGVPISGKIDRVDIYDGYVIVTDYKTGKYDNKKLSPPTGGSEDMGGDYWRQIVFYKMLLDGDKKRDYKMSDGVMDFIEKDNNGKYQKRVINVGDLELKIVGDQLKEVYENIKNHVFTPGCGDDKCHWCNFVNKNMPVNVIRFEDEEDDYEL